MFWLDTLSVGKYHSSYCQFLIWIKNVHWHNSCGTINLHVFLIVNTNSFTEIQKKIFALKILYFGILSLSPLGNICELKKDPEIQMMSMISAIWTHVLDYLLILFMYQKQLSDEFKFACHLLSTLIYFLPFAAINQIW